MKTGKIHLNGGLIQTVTGGARDPPRLKESLQSGPVTKQVHPCGASGNQETNRGKPGMLLLRLGESSEGVFFDGGKIARPLCPLAGVFELLSVLCAPPGIGIWRPAPDAG